MPFQFEVLKTDPSGARLGRLTTPHGVIETPAFMPVGTAGTVKGMTQQALEELGVGLLLANTYHLYLRPGHELIARMGGLHRFMSWPRGILTDSGGYQVFSLADLRKVSDEGVRFRSHLDGSEHLLTPEKAIEMQRALGSDIAMVLDECIEYPASRERSARRGRAHAGVGAPLPRSHRRWSARARSNPEQVFFAIVQGGAYPDLRRENAQRLVELDFPGYAVGRARGRRAARIDLRNGGRCYGAACRPTAALSDGRGQARATRRLRALRHGHDGLRAADAQRAQRLPLHPPGAAAHQATRPTRTIARPDR